MTSPVVSPPDTATLAGSYRNTSTFRIDTVLFEGSTTQTAGWLLNFVSAVAGMLMTGTESPSMRPVTVAPSRIAGGGSVKPTLIAKVRVTGSACGAIARTRPAVVTFGSSVRLTVIRGSPGAVRMT